MTIFASITCSNQRKATICIDNSWRRRPPESKRRRSSIGSPAGNIPHRRRHQSVHPPRESQTGPQVPHLACAHMVLRHAGGHMCSSHRVGYAPTQHSACHRRTDTSQRRRPVALSGQLAVRAADTEIYSTAHRLGPFIVLGIQVHLRPLGIRTATGHLIHRSDGVYTGCTTQEHCALCPARGCHILAVCGCTSLAHLDASYCPTTSSGAASIRAGHFAVQAADITTLDGLVRGDRWVQSWDTVGDATDGRQPCLVRRPTMTT